MGVSPSGWMRTATTTDRDSPTASVFVFTHVGGSSPSRTHGGSSLRIVASTVLRLRPT